VHQVVLANYSCAGATSCTGTVKNGSPIYTDQPGSVPGGYYSFKVTAKQGKTSVTKTANYNVALPTGCSAGYVALTYDDGPTPMTGQYLTALQTAGVKATFFDVGTAMQAAPSAVQAEAAAGMDVENHTWDHKDLTALTDAQIIAELQQQMTLANSLTGKTEDIYRPPFGAENGNTWDDAFSIGLREVTWTYDSNDWQSPATSQIVSNVLANSHDQAIILMHDGYPNTLNAIPQIVAGLQAKGLCAGKIVPSWDAPINNPWGYPMFVVVAPF